MFGLKTQLKHFVIIILCSQNRYPQYNTRMLGESSEGIWSCIGKSYRSSFWRPWGQPWAGPKVFKRRIFKIYQYNFKCPHIISKHFCVILLSILFLMILYVSRTQNYDHKILNFCFKARHVVRKWFLKLGIPHTGLSGRPQIVNLT